MLPRIKEQKNFLLVMLLVLVFISCLSCLPDKTSAQVYSYFLTMQIDEQLLNQIPAAEQMILLKQAQANKFSTAQIEAYIKGMINHPPQDISQKYVYNGPDLISAPYYYKHHSYYQADDKPVKNYQTKSNSSDQSGVYWIVKSKNGFIATSAWVELPDIATIHHNDRPYMFFAAHTTNAKLIGDYGLVYVPTEKAWQGFTNVQRWNGSSYSVIDQSYGDFIPADIKQLYISLSYDAGHMRLRILDAEDFSKVYFDNMVKTDNLIDNRGINLQFTREITMAQHLTTPLLDINTESVFSNASFHDCYLYTPEGFLKWSPYETTAAFVQAPFPNQFNTVRLEEYQPWNKEVVSISFAHR